MATLRIFNQHIPAVFLVLAVVETFIFIASTYMGVAVRFYGMTTKVITENIGGSVLPKALAFTFILGASMTSMGLYQKQYGSGVHGKLARIVLAFVGGMIAMSLLFYLSPSLYLGRGAMGIALAIALVGVVIVRVVFYKVHGILKRRILVLGAGNRATKLLQTNPAEQRGFIFVGFIHVEGENDLVGRNKLIAKDATLLSLSKRLEIDEIVVAVDDRRRDFPLDELLDCKMSGIDVIDVQSFFERETSKIKVDILHPSWLIFSDGFGQFAWSAFVKRGADIFFSLLLLLLTLPIMVAAAIAVRSEDGGPILFRQIRVGKDGKLFRIVKFRSMRIDAEGDGKARWATQNDDRITRIGRLIRKVRIDELPQVFNVLKGDMSFVGPRPERPEFVEKLAEKIPYFNERHRVKPGITGWAQICYPYGASEEDALEKLQFDLFYAKNHSFMLDLTVLLQTVEVILFGKGAR